MNSSKYAVDNLVQGVKQFHPENHASIEDLRQRCQVDASEEQNSHHTITLSLLTLAVRNVEPVYFHFC